MKYSYNVFVAQGASPSPISRCIGTLILIRTNTSAQSKDKNRRRPDPDREGWMCKIHLRRRCCFQTKKKRGGPAFKDSRKTPI
jgi:hypothetical protein